MLHGEKIYIHKSRENKNIVYERVKKFLVIQNHPSCHPPLSHPQTPTLNMQILVLRSWHVQLVLMTW